MNFLKKCFVRLKNDSLLLNTLHFSYVFIFLHIIGYFESNGMNFTIVRCIAIVMYQPFIFFGGRKGIVAWLIFDSFIIFWFRGTMSYAPFITIAVMCTYLKSPQILVILIFYVIVVAVNATINEIPPFRMMFHFIKCLAYYFGIKEVIKMQSQQKKSVMNLCPDETEILEFLAQGKRQNEIEKYASNTVNKKLKIARERNNIKTNDDLVLTYMSSKNREEWLNNKKQFS